MKILFICSSLEPGRDGVGDYTRLLAIELIRLGHFSVALSLNDKHITAEFQGVQQVEGIDLPVLRLPAVLDIKQRLNRAKEYIDKFDPDLLSLQFVIFGYHPKGLPVRIERQLALVGDGRAWHIMFHEIWIGITKRSPLKHKIYGFFQRRIINSIINTLHPVLITTSNGLYQTILNKNGIQAEVLPLFSNIPIAEKNAGFINNVYEQLEISDQTLDKYFIIGIFGSLYPQAKLEDTITAELIAAKGNNKNLIFISFGRIGKEGVAEFERLMHLFNGSVKFLRLGELEENQVSMLFKLLDKGISCTPAEHLGKSGVYAAMRYHNLEVIIPVNNFVPEYDTIIKNYNKLMFATKPEDWAVNCTAKSFLIWLMRHYPIIENQ